MIRIIFVDDEPKAKEVLRYLHALKKHGNIEIGPTERLREKYAASLDNNVFFNVDAAAQYFEELASNSTEWNAIDGMIIDALMEPGEILSEYFSDFSPGELSTAQNSKTGSRLVDYLNDKIVDGCKDGSIEWFTATPRKPGTFNYGKKIYLLSNLPDVLENYKNDPDYTVQEDASGEEWVQYVVDSGIELRYHYKKDPDILKFVQNMYQWMKRADDPPK